MRAGFPADDTLHSEAGYLLHSSTSLRTGLDAVSLIERDCSVASMTCAKAKAGPPLREG